ncbi:hypothetical protein HRE53_21520 [Acaryochloris sp. 'Moss Beach']|uniref:hypothetical protein n=1 Tax=Acaryochloris sp. 'Moss Beach' TaxID=2740837 RepID=UPI001F342D0C|nr:hypothetical protein [Acaryochloris sp. 'Moss Beach']UJB68979.1 hypothetical protein HRE53_21520 [Acaryochloris sp. 'Moss Beach']
MKLIHHFYTPDYQKKKDFPAVQLSKDTFWKGVRNYYLSLQKDRLYKDADYTSLIELLVLIGSDKSTKYNSQDRFLAYRLAAYFSQITSNEVKQNIF